MTAIPPEHPECCHPVPQVPRLARRPARPADASRLPATLPDPDGHAPVAEPTSSSKVLAAVIGVPVSAVAYGFLKLKSASCQHWFFHARCLQTRAPRPPGVVAAPAARSGGRAGRLWSSSYLPGNLEGTRRPTGSMTGGGRPIRVDLPGGPAGRPGHPEPRCCPRSGGAADLPSVAGWASLAVKLANQDALAHRRRGDGGAAGSFAAISTLLGSPIIGAFLLMEASGLGGPVLGLVCWSPDFWPPGWAPSSSSGSTR